MSTAIPAPSSQSYRERLPKPQVGGLVSCVWVLQVSTSGRAAYEHRSIANGCVEIACTLGTGLVRVAGPKRRPTLARSAPGETVVGVRFRPGAAPVLLGPLVAELVDLELDLDRLWGSAAVALGERLAEAATPDDAVCLLEQEVLIRSTAASEPDPLVTEAVKCLQPWRRVDVTGVASELFISPRQMRRRFVTALGYGPKTLQRILRFQGFLALSDAYGTSDVPLARLAFIAGYADQAHLSRECSRFTGLSPSVFFEEMRGSCGPTHDHAASFGGVRRALLARQVS
jgi:AraC-like DNA-binding protein